MKDSIQDFITKIFTQIKNNFGNVDNTSDANKPVSTAQATAIADAKKAGTDAQTNLSSHTGNKSNPHSVTKSQVGLGNCDNTSDADKPISTAQQTAFDNVNNNLDQLEYSEVAGGKNLTETNYTSRTRFIGVDVSHLEIGKTYTISCICKSTDTKYQTCTLYYGDTASKNLGRGFRDYYTFTHTGKGILIFACSNWTDSDGKTITCEDIQIEEGTTATDYEPYIPSVKMLSEKSKQIDDNNVLGWVVPEEMPIKNYVDSNGVFHQRVGRVDLGTVENWVQVGYEFYTDDLKLLAQGCGASDIAKAFLYGYKTTSYNGRADKGIYFVNAKPRFVVYDSAYTNLESFKNAIKGKYLYYELATEITTNVDGNEAVTKLKNDLVSLKNLFSSNITGIKLNGTTLEVSFNNGTSKGIVTFDGIAEEETIIS